jgi:GDP-D-mannose dehydratase
LRKALIAGCNGIANESPRSRRFMRRPHASSAFPLTAGRTEPLPSIQFALTPGLPLCRNDRSKRAVVAGVGISYNHESPLRPTRFISKTLVSRISLSAALARCSNEPDHVLPDDFVIGSGVTHSAREFVEATFIALGMDWTRHVTEDAALSTKNAPASILCADTGKLHRRTGWRLQSSLRLWWKRWLRRR